MKTRFEEYLENIHVFADQEAIKKRAGKKKHVLDMSKSQACAMSAADGPIDMLSRIFNEFPLVYDVVVHDKDKRAEKKIFSVGDLKTVNAWKAQYERLISSGTFQLITADNHASVITTPESELAAKDFACSVLQQACYDLLDDDGNLKLSFVATFYLDGLLARYRTNPAKTEEITHYLLFAYCTQLVATSLYDMICSRNPNDQEDYQRFGAQVKQGDYFNRFFRELFIVSDKNRALKFTPFFKNKILDCMALRAIQNHHTTKLIQYLIRRRDAHDLTSELKDFSGTKEHRVDMVESTKQYLREHYDLQTQIQILDTILENSAIGKLLSEPRHPWYDTTVAIAKSVHAWFTSTPAEPKVTNSITELRNYRDDLHQQLPKTTTPSPMKL